MAVHGVSGNPPEDFRHAVEALRASRLRGEVRLQEVPAPGRIAPFSMALTADVLDGVDRDADELASGRFVLLHDPAGREAWDGTFRVVSFVRAALEPEMGSDPLLGQVAWTWLLECLDGAGVTAAEHGGTVTRVMSDSHGTLTDRESSVEIELRASWTPRGEDLGGHLQGWADLLCTVAGLPPLPDGVSPLARGIS